MASINNLAELVRGQADLLFPDRNDQSMYLKLYGEIAEMIDAPPDKLNGEVADVFIMLLDFADRKGIDIEAAVLLKMSINEHRTWTRTANGNFQHVEK